MTKMENTIKNMEETLEKKKALMREKSAAKVTKLRERIKTKQAKIEKLTKEVTTMETECADLVGDQSVAGTETKTETFVPPGESKDAKDSTAKTATRQSTKPVKK
jgi:predicted transcriptional regulator